MNRCFVPLMLVVMALLATGCPGSKEEPQGPVAPPAGTRLRVTVVDDPALAQAIGYLQGEWEAQSGVALEISELSAADFDPQATPQVDVVIAPSWMLGPAAENGWVVPLPEGVVQHNRSDWSNILPQIRTHELAWGAKLMAVPFGSPVPVLYYRPDLLAEADRKAPASWAGYVETVNALGGAATAEPLAERWAGLTLLARSAAYATHPDNLSTLFNISTMEPLIAGPAFVRALEELVATASPRSLEMDPAAVRATFWRGEVAMAITWPTAADAGLAEIQSGFAAGVIELPGSPDVYDVGKAAWEKREKVSDGRVPLLAAAGRLGVVTSASRWPDAALQLLLWLTDEQWSGQVCSVSPNTTLFRASHAGNPSGWVEPVMSVDAAQQYADAIAAALERDQRLFALRISGRPEYLAALDEAVRAVVKGEKSPQEALDAVARRWKEITDKAGIDKQKAAYRASLGMD